MKKEILRKRVFESAWQIVEEEGIEHLNVRRIAKLSDCALGSIYNAFESFEDLLVHINAKVLTKLYEKLEGVVQAGLDKEKPFEEILRDLGIAYIIFSQAQKLIWKALFERFPNEPQPDWYGEHARKGIYALSDRLAKHVGLPEDEMKQKIGFFWASIHGVASIFLNRKMEMVAELISEDRLGQYVEYCLDGLFEKEKNLA